MNTGSHTLSNEPSPMVVYVDGRLVCLGKLKLIKKKKAKNNGKIYAWFGFSQFFLRNTEPNYKDCLTQCML